MAEEGFAGVRHCIQTFRFFRMGKPIWFAGEDRSEVSLDMFYNSLGQKYTLLSNR
jgi:hypothetical protein